MTAILSYTSQAMVADRAPNPEDRVRFLGDVLRWAGMNRTALLDPYGPHLSHQ